MKLTWNPWSTLHCSRRPDALLSMALRSELICRKESEFGQTPIPACKVIWTRLQSKFGMMLRKEGSSSSWTRGKMASEV